MSHLPAHVTTKRIQVCMGCNEITNSDECGAATNCVWLADQNTCAFINASTATAPDTDATGIACTSTVPTGAPSLAPVQQSPSAAPVTQSLSTSAPVSVRSPTSQPSAAPAVVPISFTFDGELEASGQTASTNTWIQVTHTALWFVEIITA